MDRKRSN